jgi:hypothetical protein
MATQTDWRIHPSSQPRRTQQLLLKQVEYPKGVLRIRFPVVVSDAADLSFFPADPQVSAQISGKIKPSLRRKDPETTEATKPLYSSCDLSPGLINADQGMSARTKVTIELQLELD